MTFNKTTTYAIMMLSHMVTTNRGKYSAAYLSKELNIPLQYCRQLLTDLSKKGLLSSSHGRTGGFDIAKAPGKIFLSEIVDAVEGMDSFNRCIMGFEICPLKDNKTCVLHASWEEAKNSVVNVLTTTSLKNFIEKN